MNVKSIALPVLTILLCTNALAVQRDPNGVNVNSQGATTVFITFGGLNNQVPAQAFWCGELISAEPDAIGSKCNPATIFGQLPLRYDLSRNSGQSAFTDIMSIPQNVSRRAYEAAQSGQRSSFFYVRRFVSTVGGRDEYVFVTCRLGGMGARVPFSLLDVQVRFARDENVTAIARGTTPPPFYAEIAYNGTGRLKGRWEVVLPGDELPSGDDLLPEASLPVEQRPLQRRYALIDRFNTFLPPIGKYRLEGPDPAKIPTNIEGLYEILFRVEASDDKEADSDLAKAGAGTGIVHNGAVAGFAMPVLRYYVGASTTAPLPDGAAPVQLLLPVAGARVAAASGIDFVWNTESNAPYQRLDVLDANDNNVLSAIVRAGVEHYKTPAWFTERVTAGQVLKWRVTALDIEGEAAARSGFRFLHYGQNP